MSRFPGLPNMTDIIDPVNDGLVLYDASADKVKGIPYNGVIAKGLVYVVDAAEADQGVTAAGTGLTVYDVAQLVGTSKYATIAFTHSGAANTTTYAFDTSLDLSSYPYLYFQFEPGVVLARTTGDETVTIYSPGNIKASVSQKIFNADMVSFSRGGIIHPGWWGCLPEPEVADAGVPLQYALNSLIQTSIIKLQPGSYTATTTVNIEFDQFSIFDAEGTTWTKLNTGDVFTINKNHTKQPYATQYKFGNIVHQGTDCAAINSCGGFINAYFSWQAIYGTSRQGYGFYMNADSADGGAYQSVITLDVGYISGENWAIYLSSDTNIDTITANTKHGFIYDNNRALYVRSHGSSHINSNVWNLNLDASIQGTDVAVLTNEAHSRFNLILGAIGAYNIVLASFEGFSAEYNDLTNCRPYYLAYGSTYLSDSSGNHTNIYPRFDVGPISLSVGSSPWTYQNTLHQDMYVAFSGGTVGTVHLSCDDSTYYQIATSTDTMILLPKQMYMKVTYSSAPSAVAYLY